MQFNIMHLADAYRLTTHERERTALPVLQRLRAVLPSHRETAGTHAVRFVLTDRFTGMQLACAFMHLRSNGAGPATLDALEQADIAALRTQEPCTACLST